MSDQRKPSSIAKDTAYTPVIETKARDGRPEDGWYLGLARRGERGYYQLKPGYGPYQDEKAVRDHARELNEKLGHTEAEALEIVLSSFVRLPGEEEESPVEHVVHVDIDKSRALWLWRWMCRCGEVGEWQASERKAVEGHCPKSDLTQEQG